MKRYEVELKGTTPLLHHRMTDDELMSLLGTKTERKKDKEQMTPRELADERAYRNGDKFCIPTSYIIGAFKNVASEYKQKNSQRKSMKSIAAGILFPEHEYADLADFDGRPLTTFEVDIKKATNHQKGAVAVCRPRFDEWTVKTSFTIDDELVSPDIVLGMLNDAGKRAGIGSYRVNRGGYYGRFVVTNFKEITQ